MVPGCHTHVNRELHFPVSTHLEMRAEQIILLYLNGIISTETMSGWHEYENLQILRGYRSHKISTNSNIHDQEMSSSKNKTAKNATKKDKVNHKYGNHKRMS